MSDAPNEGGPTKAGKLKMTFVAALTTGRRFKQEKVSVSYRFLDTNGGVL